MQAVVKTPPMKVEERTIPEKLIAFLKTEYQDVEIIHNKVDELVDFTESPWYRRIKKTLTSGVDMRIYRERDELTQEQLGRKLGRYTRQNISNMETDSRPISKELAKKLAAFFKVSLEKFI